MWERHIDDDMDVELMLEQAARPESALLAADGAPRESRTGGPKEPGGQDMLKSSCHAHCRLR